MTHLNGWGALGQTDPHSNSTTTFDRESGFNQYKIVVTNTGDAASGIANVGNAISCNRGTWTATPSFAYQWLRNGVPIAGAISSAYTVAEADVGTVVQCQVTASGSEGKVLAASPGFVVNPAPGTVPPSGGSASIGGTAAVGNEVTCNTGTWSGGPSFSYQWYRNGLPILSATAAKYTFVVADLNQPVQCQILGVNAGGATLAFTAASVVKAAPPLLTTTPAISGTLTGNVGNTEVCDTGFSENSPTSFTYQWLRNGQPIAGANGYPYILTPADEGKAIQCKVAAANAGGAGVNASTVVVVSPAPSPSPPVPPAAGLAEPSGGNKLGETMTCSAGSWGGSPTFTYQWLSNGQPIAGATASTYVVQGAVIPSNIQCEVLGTNAGGSTIADSKNRVTNPNPSPNPPKVTVTTVDGAATVGVELSCSTGTWSGSPSFSYQWLRGGGPIAGATSSTYTPVAADDGKTLQCQVTATNPDGSSDALTAQVVVAPAPAGAPPARPTAAISVTGTASVGSVLTCQAGNWGDVPSVASFRYVWLRGGAPISGADSGPTTAASNTYTLAGADLGKLIQCQVLASSPSGSIEAVSVGSMVAPTVPSATTAPSTPLSVFVADQLPPGLRLAHTNSNGQLPLATGTGWSCVVSNSNTSVSCTRSDPLAAAASYPAITLFVHVELNAPLGDPASGGGVVNQVTVSGGGLNGGTSAYDPTVIATSVPFGIQSFTTSVTNAAGEPFTLAGGHPFAASTRVVFNQTSVDGGFLQVAGGQPKDIEIELPPGFIGNPQSLPHCSLETKLELCPANTAVGYMANSNNRPLIYNLIPPPGVPAEFGFHVSTGDFYLFGHLRSDGDYGITVGSDGIASPLPSAREIQVTFCAGGASGVEVQGGLGLEYSGLHCNGLAPGATPLLTNPSNCSGQAPVTTARMASYQEPANYAAMDSYVGALSAPSAAAGEHTTTSPVASSFLIDCSHLNANWTEAPEYEPRFSFQPETTQADTPSAYAVELHVPQPGGAPSTVAPGVRLDCVNPEWVNGPTGFAYQWSRDGAPIAGATASTYLAQAADQGTALQCIVTATNAGGGAADTADPALIVPPAPGTTPPAAPPIKKEIFGGNLENPDGIVAPTGTASSGNTLTCATGTWSGSPVFTYQWLKNGAPISGATGSTYVVQSGDVPSNLQCAVTATNAGGAVTAVSANKLTTTVPTPTPPSLSPGGTVQGSVFFGGPPQVSVSTQLASTNLDNTTVVLPKGVTLNPSAADGLQACSEQQIGVSSESPLHFNEAEPACPDASKVGKLEIVTPLLENPLHGSVYLAAQNANPFHSTFAIYLAIDDPTTGIVVKLAGEVHADEHTGQLTATFKNNPQLPFEDFRLEFFKGPRAALANPQGCGTFTTNTELTPWSAADPNNPTAAETATPSDHFTIGSGCTGGFAPSFVAGTEPPAAGAFSPFTVTISRKDGEQDLSGVTVHAPAGLLGKIAGIPRCGEEQANAGTCSFESQIGTTTVGAGPGEHPFFLGGKVYLTGPYKGGPFGLSVVVPAIAGPFNLGNVVVRAAIAVNPSDATLTVTSDPLPQYVDGVQLRVRTIHVAIDRAGFTFNPTNCASQQVGGTISGEHVGEGEANQSVSVSNPFAVQGCATLPFKPSFSASTQGATSRTEGASLDVMVGQKSGEANIHKVDVQLPVALPSRLSTLKLACPEAQFAANPAGCPKESNVGTATATTPVLNVPLTGPAYLVSHGGAEFPDLEVVLQGEGITLVLDGKTEIKNGITYSKFETVPDAPIQSFELKLPEGPYSALAAPGGSLCGKRLVMPTTITGQNGAVLTQSTKIAVTGCVTKPSITITKLKLSGNLLLVTLKTSETGRARLSGYGLVSTVVKNLKPGTHTVRVHLTKAGQSRRDAGKRTKLRVSLSAGKGATAKTKMVRL